MKKLIALFAFTFVFTACGGSKLGEGLGAPGPSQKVAGPGAATTFNLSDFPNVIGKVYGMWAVSGAVGDGHGGTRGVRMFFAKNKVGISVECLSGSYDVTSSMSVQATVTDQGEIKIPLAGRFDTASSDGQFICTASLAPGKMKGKVTGNAMTLQDTGGHTNALSRLLFF